jgi:hypothetical protein
MKPMGPPPVFKQELRNEKVKIGDKITLTCQGKEYLNHVITDSIHLPLVTEAECRHFHRNLPLDLSLIHMGVTHILTLIS